MKCFKIILLAVMTAFCCTACSQTNSTQNMETKKVLVAYFSATGTTKHVAEQLARIVNANLCEIVPAQPYTSADLDWNDRRSRSSMEMNDANVRPQIKAVNVNVGDYDLIFLGFPIWWDLAPRVVNTFIESNDLRGKVVIPFATSGGSSITAAEAALHKSYPQINWLAGKLLNHANERNIQSWWNTIEESL